MNGTPLRRRRRTWLLITLVLAPFIVCFLATRSFILAPIVANILHSTTGRNIHVGIASWDWSGGLTLYNVVLEANDIQGPAAEIIAIPKLEIHFVHSIPLFSSEIKSIRMDSATVRLAESLDVAGEYNFSYLLPVLTDFQPLGSEDTANTEGNPDSTNSTNKFDFVFKQLIVETGAMDNNQWILENASTFSVSPLVTNNGTHFFTLNEVKDHLKVDLSLSKQEVKVSIDAIDLPGSVINFLPRTARVWCEETNFNGQMNSFHVRWDHNNGIQIEAIVEDIHLLFPEEHGIRWVHYDKGEISPMQGDAAVDVKSGKIIYGDNALELIDFEGKIVPAQSSAQDPVKFRVDLEISELPAIGGFDGSQWMDAMLSGSPFEAKFFIDDFHPTEGGEGDLPLGAAQILKIFQLKQWHISSKIGIKREKVGGDVQVGGELLLSGASGMYEGFPYPLRDITSLIKINNDEIEVVYLKALGSNDAKVHISGKVIATSDNLVVDLNIHSPSAPLDLALQKALPNDISDVMRKLFSQEEFNKVASSLPDSFGQSYSFGGVIDLDLHVLHDSSRDNDVVVEGEVSFENVGILYEEFPFPVTLEKGRIQIDSTGFYIPEDESILFTGTGGGSGELKGYISFTPDGFASPHLEFKLVNEWITPSLIKAISQSAGTSHDIALGVLSGLGLESRLKAEGRIDGTKNGTIDSLFSIQIEDGLAVPNKHLAEAIHVTGPFWPENFDFKKVNAEIQIANGKVTMNGATCECGTGSVDVSMSIDGGIFELALDGYELPISSRLVDVLPDSASNALANSWSMLQPSGFMDATIRINHTEEIDSLYMKITPNTLVVSGDNKDLELQLSSGEVIVENTDVFFNDLKFSMVQNEKHHGALQIAGFVFGSKDKSQIDLSATLQNATIDSPLTRAITGIVGGDWGLDYYDSLQPIGMGSASLEAKGNLDDIIYNIEIIPTKLIATFTDRLAVMEFGEDYENRIRFNNEGIVINDIGGKLGDGRLNLNGKINTKSNVRGSFQLDWEGPSRDESLFAVLPSAVGDTLEAIDISDGRSILPDGLVTISGENWDDLTVRFDGDIHLEDVSINVGVPLTEIIGEVKVDGKYDEKQLSELQFELKIEEMTTIGRPVNFVTGKLLLNQDEQRLYFDDMSGESTTGGVSVDGWIAIDESKEFEIEILVAGAKIAAENEEDAMASLEGELTGWLSIAGVRGNPKSKRGVGMLRVRNGKLKIDPFSNTTMHLLQLALPTAKTISGADIDLYINAEQVVLERISLTSNNSVDSDLVVEGEGTIDFDSFTLNARLHPKVGVPIIRDIAGALNESFYSIDVNGQLFNPTVSVVPLPFLSPLEK